MVDGRFCQGEGEASDVSENRGANWLHSCMLPTDPSLPQLQTLQDPKNGWIVEIANLNGVWI